MSERQKTIQKEITLSGVGLHTGNKVTVRLKPAKENAGICFVRIDLPQKPMIKANIENIIDAGIPRCTSIGKDGAIIHTVEHLMGSLCGSRVDNVEVEIDGNEIPGLDGSSLPFFKAIQDAGVVEQSAERSYIEIKEPVSAYRNGASVTVVPDPEFKISYALSYNHPFVSPQFFTATIDEEVFGKEVAPSRTFCLEEEAKALQTSGLGKGANYENTLIVGEKGIIKNKVRFPNELARHKVLDFIGDSYLLGRPIRGHVFAMKSGHGLNLELLKKIDKQRKSYEKRSFIPACDLSSCKELDINRIMRLLPHRYPFLLVDRVVEIEKGKKARGIKNVTINENFFNGHFPTRPIMPGVLMVEAMAQVGGILVLTNEEHQGKVALFMATDNVKFRKLVQPGDQLILEVEVIRDRPRTAFLHAHAKVADEIVAEADLMFSFTDASFLD
jgi:UDP-3-O-[3-hydroxymyristoyl] N-acetylglucosamine deacetylase/3-hydroxyacyl-[acyl-carrier-protein] dehydratase